MQYFDDFLALVSHVRIDLFHAHTLIWSPLKASIRKMHLWKPITISLTYVFVRASVLLFVCLTKLNMLFTDGLNL